MGLSHEIRMVKKGSTCYDSDGGSASFSTPLGCNPRTWAVPNARPGKSGRPIDPLKSTSEPNDLATPVYATRSPASSHTTRDVGLQGLHQGEQ